MGGDGGVAVPCRDRGRQNKRGLKRERAHDERGPGSAAPAGGDAQPGEKRNPKDLPVVRVAGCGCQQARARFGCVAQAPSGARCDATWRSKPLRRRAPDHFRSRSGPFLRSRVGFTSTRGMDPLAGAARYRCPVSQAGHLWITNLHLWTGMWLGDFFLRTGSGWHSCWSAHIIGQDLAAIPHPCPQASHSRAGVSAHLIHRPVHS